MEARANSTTVPEESSEVSRPLDDAELEGVADGTSQETYEEWERLPDADKYDGTNEGGFSGE